MRTSFKLLIPAAGWMVWSSAVVLAQDDVKSTEAPNSMGAHTWFIIVAVGALLAWGISYSLTLQREALARKRSQDELGRRKEEILEEIVELERRKETGEVTESKYTKESKELRHQLSRVVEQQVKR